MFGSWLSADGPGVTFAPSLRGGANVGNQLEGRRRWPILWGVFLPDGSAARPLSGFFVAEVRYAA